MPPLTHDDPSLEEIVRGNTAAALQAHMEVNHGKSGKAVVPPIYAGPGAESPGSEFVRSSGYKDWVQRFPDGGPASRGEYHGDPAEVRFRLGQRQLTHRALVTSADAAAGSLVRPDYGPLEPGIVRPLTIRDLVTVIPTQSDQVDFPRELTRTLAAAPVAEATALTGTSGTKPEGGLTFELVQVPIRTIAEWVPATKRIVADAGFLRAYVDDYLMQDIEEELEDQMISGAGTGENFLGILNTTGIGDAGSPGAGESALDVIREAVRLVQVDGRVNPSGLVVHPADSEKIDRLKINSEVNHFVRDPYGPATQPAIYGMPVVVTTAIPAGTGLVGDFRKAVLFDREQVAISVGTAGDDFIRNIVRVLGELRAGFTVARVKAFAKLTVP